MIFPLVRTSFPSISKLVPESIPYIYVIDPLGSNLKILPVISPPMASKNKVTLKLISLLNTSIKLSIVQDLLKNLDLMN